MKLFCNSAVFLVIGFINPTSLAKLTVKQRFDFLTYRQMIVSQCKGLFTFFLRWFSCIFPFDTLLSSRNYHILLFNMSRSSGQAEISFFFFDLQPFCPITTSNTRLYACNRWIGDIFFSPFLFFTLLVRFSFSSVHLMKSRRKRFRSIIANVLLICFSAGSRYNAYDECYPADFTSPGVCFHLTLS